MRLQVVSSNSTYYWSVTNAAPAKPYLQISNQYLPLTTATRAGVKLKIQSGTSTYRAAVYESAYYNTTSNAVGNLSSTTALTRPSTSGYLTRPSTSGYLTRPSTSGYLTRPSTSGYLTRSSLVSTAPAILTLSSKSELQAVGVKGAIVQASLANITYSTSTMNSLPHNSTYVLVTLNLSDAVVKEITYTVTATNGYPGGNKTYTRNIEFARSTAYNAQTMGRTYATPPLPMSIYHYSTLTEAHGGSIMQVYATYSTIVGAFSSTRPSTSGYLTRPSTSGYLTRPSTSGYLTRPSTSGYLTRPSTSAYSGKLSSSKWG